MGIDVKLIRELEYRATALLTSALLEAASPEIMRTRRLDLPSRSETRATSELLAALTDSTSSRKLRSMPIPS